MSKGIFITGTGTDIGKTYVTGLIVKKLRESGADAAYYKAAMSGNDRRIWHPVWRATRSRWIGCWKIFTKSVKNMSM